MAVEINNVAPSIESDDQDLILVYVKSTCNAIANSTIFVYFPNVIYFLLNPLLSKVISHSNTCIIL